MSPSVGASKFILRKHDIHHYAMIAMLMCGFTGKEDEVLHCRLQDASFTSKNHENVPPIDSMTITKCAPGTNK